MGYAHWDLELPPRGAEDAPVHFGLQTIGGPGPSAPRLNLDRFGLPRDFATYEWLNYRKRVSDDSPERLAFEHKSGLIPPSRDTR